MSAKKKPKKELAPLRLDLGCGKNPRPGFIGVDSRDFGQDHVIDLCQLKKGVPRWEILMPPEADAGAIFEPWPWATSSVTEIHCSHFVEHLTRRQRVHFANELYRVLVPEGTAKIIFPHWCSPRAYGDMTHDPMPVAEWWFLYVNKGWREAQAPHNDGYTCNFEISYAPLLRGDITAGRSQDYVNYAMANYKDAIQDIDSTWTAKK